MVQRSALPLSTGKNYKVVTLCGSTRFKEQYMEVMYNKLFVPLQHSVEMVYF